MKPAEIKTRLRGLGLRLQVDIVREAVQRLKNGESVYSLYGRSDHIMAKATALKIRSLWKQGELSFVLDVSSEIAMLEEASKDAVLVGDPLGGSTLAKLVDVPKRVKELQPQLPKLDWAVEVLERAGIEVDEALAMMSERDALLWMGKTEGRWSKAERIRFVELHYMVFFAGANRAQAHRAPLELIRFAARNYAAGLVDGNSFMTKLGLDVLRYQVWRGSAFLKAFQAAQMPISSVARRRSQEMNEELDRILTELPLGEATEISGEENGDV